MCIDLIALSCRHWPVVICINQHRQSKNHMTALPLCFH
jgi:hypothetical protein